MKRGFEKSKYLSTGTKGRGGPTPPLDGEKGTTRG